MAIKAHWKGKSADDPNHEFLEGVPAKHLGEDEFDALTTEQRAAVRKRTDLYDVRTDAEMKASGGARQSRSRSGERGRSGEHRQDAGHRGDTATEEPTDGREDAGTDQPLVTGLVDAGTIGEPQA